MIKAVRFEIITVGTETYIQLYDENNTPIEGKDAYWDGNFDCSFNKLTSLEGAPNSVGGDFDCSNNNLTSLNYLPFISGKLFCIKNNFQYNTILHLIYR